MQPYMEIKNKRRIALLDCVNFIAMNILFILDTLPYSLQKLQKLKKFLVILSKIVKSDWFT